MAKALLIRIPKRYYRLTETPVRKNVSLSAKGDFKWSTGESNPDLLYAKQMSSRWTSTPFRFLLQHAPKDSNPDILGWNQQCYRYTKGVQFFVFVCLNLTQSQYKTSVGTQGIAPLANYHTIYGRRVTTSRVETLPRGFLRLPRLRVGLPFQASSGSRGTRTHNGFTRSCFQNSVLIRPDDFRC